MTAPAYRPADAYFGDAFVDTDEWREVPLRHRYVHGGFEGTDTRFSFYFPDPAHYAGRFLTSVEGGVGGHESRATGLPAAQLGSIGHAVSVGAYLVESNGGHVAGDRVARSRGSQPGSVTGYRATEQAARYARLVAEQMYGALPHHGYIFGGSGGGWRTILAIENTEGLWDGAVAYISPAGHGVSFPSIVANGARVLGGALASVVAAWDPGGSGDPFAELTTAQREELGRLYRAGLQPGAEFQLLAPTLELNVLMTTSQMHADFDAEYFTDFWTRPGHAGADGELDDVLLETTARITAVLTAGQLRAQGHDASVAPGLADDEPAGLRTSPQVERAEGTHLEVVSGPVRGHRFRCLERVADVLVLDASAAAGIEDLAVGDELRVSNRDYLAYCHAYRHQVDPSSPESAQFLVGGRHMYPQRPLSVADVLAGVRTRADFHAKLIYLANLQDTLASPLGGTLGYLGRVRATLGAAAAERTRLWLNENAGHRQGSELPARHHPSAATRLVDWHGSVAQAIEDVIAWVEQEHPPPEDTRFDYEDGRISLPDHAGRRCGIQPVVRLTANGQPRTVARVGEPVEFVVVAEAPVGVLVEAEWNVDGGPTWYRLGGRPEGRHLAASVSHGFDEAGSYYPAVRVWSDRSGADRDRRTWVPNLARVRVDVN